MAKPRPDERAAEIAEVLELGKDKPASWLVKQLAHLMAKREGQAAVRGDKILEIARKQKEPE